MKIKQNEAMKPSQVIYRNCQQPLQAFYKFLFPACPSTRTLSLHLATKPNTQHAINACLISFHFKKLYKKVRSVINGSEEEEIVKRAGKVAESKIDSVGPGPITRRKVSGRFRSLHGNDLGRMEETVTHGGFASAAAFIVHWRPLARAFLFFPLFSFFFFARRQPVARRFPPYPPKPGLLNHIRFSRQLFRYQHSFPPFVARLAVRQLFFLLSTLSFNAGRVTRLHQNEIRFDNSHLASRYLRDE